MTDLESILAGRDGAPAPENETPVEATKEAQEQPAEAPEAEAPSDGDKPGTVPHAALAKEREKVKRYTEQVAEFERKLAEQDARWAQRFEQLTASLQPKPQAPQAPDFWEAPEQAMDYRLNQALTPVQQALQSQREEFSRMMAIEKFGEGAINEAYQALAGLKAANPAEFQAAYSKVMSSPHPFGSLVNWHAQQKTLSEIGTDPEAYREKIKAEILAEMQANGGQPGALAAPAAAMPSNFATARNVGTRAGPAWAGPTPLADIFASR
jgi:hypothetical protein